MTNEKRDRNVRRVFLIFCIAFILFVAYAGYGLYQESTAPPFIGAFPIDENETEDHVIVHLTEEDFEKWPFLEEAIKEDSNAGAPELDDPMVLDTFREEYMYNSTIEKPIYVEYEGEYFNILIGQS
ncbi:hypothetical protein RJ40_01740 [Methanofollis aquaemaris]|uniref:Uncharacterized protein n=1 Tax=Methanofollis aquaemaris TaxID=126734 RepID=A0A8A3S3S6_9EURY|nr:hypothetical protein [Methanofollis aquaemaris]QSZ66310.1 hypothetical protein RJ40_01740 [Methanofollis aquaemaris]